MWGKQSMQRIIFGVTLLSCLVLSACSSVPKKKPVQGESFTVDEVVQSDGNRVANLIMRDNLDSLQRLLDKLYRRNPVMWQRSGAASRDEAVRQVMTAIRNQQPLPPLGQVKSTQALTTAFAPAFDGDRAGVLIYGLGSMLVDAYGGKINQNLITGLDAQQLANASYNVEVAVWMLSNKRGADGQLMLLSNEIGANGQNLSFEREFGKIVGRLDLLAAATDEKYRRILINYAQGMVGAPLLEFLPVLR